VFKKIKNKTNLSHVRHTYGLSPTTEDKDIYQLATKEKRFVITIDEDFKRLVKPMKAGIIFIGPHLSNDQMDNAILEFITGKNPDDFWGKATKI